MVDDVEVFFAVAEAGFDRFAKFGRLEGEDLKDVVSGGIELFEETLAADVIHQAAAKVLPEVLAVPIAKAFVADVAIGLLAEKPLVNIGGVGSADEDAHARRACIHDPNDPNVTRIPFTQHMNASEEAILPHSHNTHTRSSGRGAKSVVKL